MLMIVWRIVDVWWTVMMLMNCSSYRHFCALNTVSAESRCTCADLAPQAQSRCAETIIFGSIRAPVAPHSRLKRELLFHPVLLLFSHCFLNFQMWCFPNKNMVFSLSKCEVFHDLNVMSLHKNEMFPLLKMWCFLK